MTLKNINLKSGNIIYDDFNINPYIPYEDQINNLSQDLLQIEFAEDFVIDIGWYPDNEAEGCFGIYVVKDGDWTTPLLLKGTRDFHELEQYLQGCIDLIEKLIAANIARYAILKKVFLKGVGIDYYDFNVDPNISLESQAKIINEKLIKLIESNYLIDVSWLKDSIGFVVEIIKDKKKETPLYKKESKNLSELECSIQEAIDLVISQSN